MVKDGMFGGWVFVVGGTRSVALGGNMVAATQHNNELIIKIGTYGGWGFHSGQVCHTALASNWLGTLREDTGVVAKDVNQGEWIFETAGVKQIAVSKDGNASTSDLDDIDCDDSFNDADNCPATHNPNQLNTDVVVNPPGDAQGDVCDLNDDNDACTDAQEGGPSEALGGDRNPLDPWDFYDVTGDGNIDLSDTLEILAHFGHGPNDDASDNALDRAILDEAKQWRTSASDDGVDITDALNNLASFGHSCG